MTVPMEKLSAYLDAELPDVDIAEIDDALARDPQVQAELAALVKADAFAKETFERELNAPVSLDLIRHIKNTPIAPKVVDTVSSAPSEQTGGSLWGRLAAGLAILAIGGFGGYAYKDQTTPEPQRPGWIAAVAEYHGVYADQKRHLVEVGADETEHIQTWLGNTVGASFNVPDLAEFGLTFQGGRLVVANGKPVAQLMYTQADGAVVALCLQKSGKDPSPDVIFNEQKIDRFDFVSWSANGADYVVIGPSGLQGLTDIAESAAQKV